MIFFSAEVGWLPKLYKWYNTLSHLVQCLEQILVDVVWVLFLWCPLQISLCLKSWITGPIQARILTRAGIVPSSSTSSCIFVDLFIKCRIKSCNTLSLTMAEREVKLLWYRCLGSEEGGALRQEEKDFVNIYGHRKVLLAQLFTARAYLYHPGLGSFKKRTPLSCPVEPFSAPAVPLFLKQTWSMG